MASASMIKSSPVLGKSEWVKGQSLRQSSALVVRCHPISPSALTIRAGSYADELVKAAKTVASPERGILAMDESKSTCGKLPWDHRRSRKLLRLRQIRSEEGEGEDRAKDFRRIWDF